jgi:hypothetical protein
MGRLWRVVLTDFSPFDTRPFTHRLNHVVGINDVITVKTSRVLWPEIIIATFSLTPTFIRFLIAVRCRS